MTDPTERIEELALECLRRRAVEGESVVDEVCSEHPAHADDIRGILQRLERVGLLEESADSSPSQIGDFVLEQRLGSGGMGVVHLARQVSLERRVALKVMRSGIHRDPKSRERFRREIATISKLDHPGICTVYEAGEADGTPYLAMRYVDGQSLATLLEERRKRTSATGSSRRHASGTSTSQEVMDDVYLVERVARALHIAHEAGVVHRDVKPGNIMVDRDGEPVVMDFGLAREEDADRPRLTRSGEALGTPEYMAPEQVSGSGAVDRRTDVYALGVTLYECLTRRPPFDARKRESLYRQILTDVPPDPRSYNRHVGGELRAVLEKALEKEPRRRFATALELADELRRIRKHEPIRTRAPGPVLRGVRWCQRNRAAAIVMAAVTAALLASLWFLYEKTVAERQLRALALMVAADDVRDEDPRLAAKLGREALRLHDDPRIIFRFQEALFDLRDVQILHETDQRLEWVQQSPDGDHLLITSGTTKPALYRSDGTAVGELPYKSLGQRPASVAFSRDGTEIVLADASGRIHVFDVDDPSQPRETVDTGAREVSFGTLDISTDNQRILFSHGAGATLWNRSPGELLTLDSPSSALFWCGAFLQDDVVAAGALWRSDGTQLASLVGYADDHEQQVRFTLVSPQQDRFLTASSDRARLWRRNGTPICTILRDEGDDGTRAIFHAEFSPSGNRILVTFVDGPVWVLDADGTFLHGWQTGRTVIGRFSPDGQRIYTADWMGTVQVWDLEGRELLSLRGHRHGVTWIEFLDDQGQRVLTTSWDGTARIWNIGPVPGVRLSWGHHWPDVAVVGDNVVFTTGRGEAVLCDTAGRRLKSLPVGPGRHAVDPAPDGHRVLLTSPGEGTLRLWDTTSQEPPRVLQSPVQNLWNAQLRADGKIGFSGSARPVTIWDPVAGEETLERPLGEETVYVVVRASPDGSVTLAGKLEGGVQLLSPNWQVLHEIPRLLARSIAFSPSGPDALIGCGDGAAYMVDLERGAIVDRYPGHHGFIRTVAFAPDGDRFATGTSDSTVRVWERGSQEPMLVLRDTGRSAMIRVAFLRRDLILTTSLDGTVRWWWLERESLLNAVDRIGLEELTPEELRRFANLLGR